jgi:hypothetical protein
MNGSGCGGDYASAKFAIMRSERNAKERDYNNFIYINIISNLL